MKKLLGLLAVAPLSLAACGGAKDADNIPSIPQAEENEVRFIADNGKGVSQLIISHIELSGADDHDGYDALGKVIRDTFVANPSYFDADKLIMTGTVDGTEFNEVINIAGITDGTTTATTLKEALEINWVATTDLTKDGVMAKAMRAVGSHAIPDDIDLGDYSDFEAILHTGEHFDSTMTKTAWDTKFYPTAADAVVANEYNINNLSEYTGFSDTFEKIVVAGFSSTDFIFEKYYVASHNRVVAYYHHEADPTAQWALHWTADLATA